MSKTIKRTKKALSVAAKVMTPEQRLNAIAGVLMAEQVHRTKDEPIELTTPPFALINDDIKHITVRQFIQVVVHNDYTSLILAGEPSDEQKAEALENIMFQYHDVIMDDKTEVYIKTVTNIHELQIKMNRVNMNIEALTFVLDPGIIEELKADGYNYQFTEETYLKDIQRIQTALKRDKIAMQKAKNRLSELQGGSKGKKPTEDDILSNLAELRKFENYQSEPLKLAEELTVYGYAQAMKRYNKELELKRKQAERK